MYATGIFFLSFLVLQYVQNMYLKFKLANYLAKPIFVLKTREFAFKNVRPHVRSCLLVLNINRNIIQKVSDVLAYHETKKQGRIENSKTSGKIFTYEKLVSNKIFSSCH